MAAAPPRLWAGLPQGASVLVDTAPWIYVLESHPQFADRFVGLFEAAAKGHVLIALSTITLAEVLTGPFKAGQTALLIDDVVSLAYSKFEAIEKLEHAGLIVHDLLMVVDRQQGGVQALEEKGYRTHTVINLSQLLERYLETGKIDRARYDEVRRYVGL